VQRFLFYIVTHTGYVLIFCLAADFACWLQAQIWSG